MVVMVLEPRVVNSPASRATKSPAISEGPSRMILPDASGEMRMDPAIFLQPVYCAACAMFVMVAVPVAEQAD